MKLSHKILLSYLAVMGLPLGAAFALPAGGPGWLRPVLVLAAAAIALAAAAIWATRT